MPYLRLKTQKEKFLNPPDGLQCQHGFSALAASWSASIPDGAYKPRPSRESYFRRVPILYRLVLLSSRFLIQPDAFDPVEKILELSHHLNRN